MEDVYECHLTCEIITISRGWWRHCFHMLKCNEILVLVAKYDVSKHQKEQQTLQ